MEDIDEIIDSGTGIVEEETYRGHKITVKRLKAEDCQLVHGVSSGGGPDSETASPTASEYFKYEFEAYVDGEPVTVAGEIETRGYEKPWIPTLVQYTKAYLDGLHSGVERDNPYTEWNTDSFQGD